MGLEYRVRTSGGDYRWMIARALPVRGPGGEVLRWAGTWTDVDDLKRLNEQLGGQGGTAASLAILEASSVNRALGIGFVDRELRIVHMNELLAGLNGLSPDEAQGRSLPEVMGSIWPRVEPFYRQVLETGEADRQRRGWRGRTSRACPATGSPATSRCGSMAR